MDMPRTQTEIQRQRRGQALPALTAALEETLLDVPAAARVVAVSGGRDSLTLLRALCALHAAARLAPPRALHVHHGLDPAADAWGEQVTGFCGGLEVPVTIVRVSVEATGDGVEAAARRARYDAFVAHLAADEHLLLAQHAEDQVETVLLRLLRGAGPRGLAGMPRRRRLGAGWLLRPWLEQPGDHIEAAARSFGLSWIEDPANGASNVDRAWLRGQFLPQLRARWPGAEAGVLRSAAACAEAEAALAGLLPSVPADGAPLPLAHLGSESSRRLAVLRAWFDAAGLSMPPRTRLEELLRQLGAPRDAELCVAFGAVEVRRYEDQLHLLPRQRPPPEGARIALAPGAHHLGCGLLELLPAADSGPALRADLAHCEVRFRGGGERLRLPGRPGTTLKRLLQGSGVPPWERDRIPLLCAEGEVLAVADLALGEAGLAAPGTPGLTLRWTPDRDRVGRIDASGHAPSVGSEGDVD